MIYFVADRLTGYVKIGVAADAERRFSKIQSDSPGELSMLAVIPGGLAEEASLHQLFADYRVRGEWFRNTGALETFISGLEAYERPARTRRAKALLADRLSTATGMGLRSARSWVARSRIPGWHWRAIAVAGVMTYEDLAARFASIPSVQRRAA